MNIDLHQISRFELLVKRMLEGMEQQHAGTLEIKTSCELLEACKAGLKATQIVKEQFESTRRGNGRPPKKESELSSSAAAIKMRNWRLKKKLEGAFQNQI